MVYQRPPKRARPRRLSNSYTFQPPMRGLALNEPLGKSKPGGARVLINWFPTATGARIRAGSLKTATVPAACRRLFTYKSGQVEEMFASTDAAIYKVSNVANPNVAPAASISGGTSGYYSTAQIGTAGGNYLYAVNGTDEAILYDGATFKRINATSTPAITGILTTLLSFTWLYASRLFFVEKSTMRIWYLPVDSIGGAAASFSLAGVFQKGGSVLFGGVWSQDSGSGLDDKCVIVSTEGEVAVFQGTNPGSAADWQKVGIYEITEPMGPNGTMSAGGDLLVATTDGIVPISEAVNKDAAALSLSAVTRSIEPEWKKQAGIRRSKPWEIMKWPSANMMVVSLPGADASIPTLCYAANLQTGGWGFFTGWDVQCMAHFGKRGYFGTLAGTINRMEETGSDNGMPYVCTYVAMPDDLRGGGAFQTVHSARAVFNANIPFNPKISASMDYKIALPTPPNSAADTGSGLWDVALWDVDVWDAGSVQEVVSKWVSIGRSGIMCSPQIQITSGTNAKPNIELLRLDVMHESGEFQV